jgi:hypothetical protein
MGALIRSGLEQLLGNVGLDPAMIDAHVEGVRTLIRNAAAELNANQRRIESKLDAIDAKLAQMAAEPASTREILDAEGNPSHVLITNERFPQAMIDDVNGVGRKVANGPALVMMNPEAASAAEERSAGEA